MSDSQTRLTLSGHPDMDPDDVRIVLALLRASDARYHLIITTPYPPQVPPSGLDGVDWIPVFAAVRRVVAALVVTE
jgi:hypothetical protein